MFSDDTMLNWDDDDSSDSDCYDYPCDCLRWHEEVQRDMTGRPMYEPTSDLGMRDEQSRARDLEGISYSLGPTDTRPISGLATFRESHRRGINHSSHDKYIRFRAEDIYVIAKSVICYDPKIISYNAALDKIKSQVQNFFAKISILTNNSKWLSLSIGIIKHPSLLYPKMVLGHICVTISDKSTLNTFND